MTMPHPKGWRIGLAFTPQTTPPGWAVGLLFFWQSGHCQAAYESELARSQLPKEL